MDEFDAVEAKIRRVIRAASELIELIERKNCRSVPRNAIYEAYDTGHQNALFEIRSSHELASLKVAVETCAGLQRSGT